MQSNEALDYATRQWFDKWRKVIGEFSGEITRDTIKALAVVNEYRVGLAQILPSEVEDYDGQLTDENNLNWHNEIG